MAKTKAVAKKATTAKAKPKSAMAVLLLIPFMKFRGVNVVRLLLINMECVGGLQFDKHYKHYLLNSINTV